jgi:hypothetical protein
VRAYLDRNRNLGIDPSEPWDSVAVNVTDSVSTTILMFVHDTVPPRIRDLLLLDSVTLRVFFDKPVAPTQTLSAANFAVIGPDSAPVPIVSVGAALKDTAVKPVNAPIAAPPPRAAVARPAPPRDTTTAVKPVMPRPSPITEIVITLRRPLAPSRTYRVRAIGIRGLLGHTGDSERPIAIPAPPPQPTVKPAVTPTPPPPVKR